MSESWRPVVGYFNVYEVSNLGRVRSRDHEVWGGPVAGFYTKKGRVLRPGIGSHGYPTVVLGKGNTRTVHSLVAEAFLGPCPPGQEVRHSDDNRANPVLENLQYGTRAQNMLDASVRGRLNPNPSKMLETRDRKYPGWRQRLFSGVDNNPKKAVATKDARYGRKNWHAAQIAGVAYSKKGGA
jgi:hypothetical protein